MLSHGIMCSKTKRTIAKPPLYYGFHLCFPASSLRNGTWLIRLYVIFLAKLKLIGGDERIRFIPFPWSIYKLWIRDCIYIAVATRSFWIRVTQVNSAVHLNVIVTRLDQSHFLRNTQSILQKTKRILVKELFSDWMLKSLNKMYSFGRR